MSTEQNTRTLPAGYLEAAARTAIYSPQWSVIYPALGLGNEVAELAEKVMGGAPAVDVLPELGDVLWYVAALARDARVEERELAYEAPDARFSMSPLTRLIAAAGSAQGHVKKALRDHDGDLDSRRAGLIGELHIVLAAADVLATALGSTLQEVAEGNLAKLADRAARDALQGDGDVR